MFISIFINGVTWILSKIIAAPKVKKKNHEITGARDLRFDIKQILIPNMPCWEITKGKRSLFLNLMSSLSKDMTIVGTNISIPTKIKIPPFNFQNDL